MQFATLEVVITTLQDAYGKWIQAYLRRHEVLVLLTCLVSCGLGLPHVMQVRDWTLSVGPAVG